jgi:hypothetical protein
MSPDPKTQINKGLPFRSGTAGVNIPTIGSDFANVPVKQPWLQPKVAPTTTPVMQSTAKPQTQPSQAQSSSFKWGWGQTNTNIPTNIPVSDISWVAWVNKPVVGSQFNKPTWSEQTQVSSWSTETRWRIKKDIEKQNYDMNKAITDLSLDMKNVISEWRTPDFMKLKQLYPEFADIDDEILMDLTADIGNVVKDGREIDTIKLKELYPELWGKIVSSEVEWKNPLIRWAATLLWAWWWWLKWLFKEWIYEWGKEMIEDSKRILNSNKTSWEKFAQILIWEFGMNFLGWIIWDTVGWVMWWAYKWFTSESERKYLNQEVWDKILDMVNVAKTNPDIQVVMQKYNELPPEAKQDLNDLLWYTLDASNFLWVEAFW